jgi:hypothetical protein
LGRISSDFSLSIQDRPDVAEEHFQACSQLCSPSADDEKGDDAGGSGKRGAPMKIRLAHMQGGADVSAEGVETHLQTIQLRHDLKDAPARIRKGADAAGKSVTSAVSYLYYSRAAMPSEISFL